MVSTGPELLPIDVSPDARVLAFALAATVLTVLLFGTVPALRATRLELAPSLKEGRGIAGGSARNRLARGLIVGQVALSLALLCGAGLFLRSLANLTNVDIGFDAGDVLVTNLDAASAGYREDLRLEDMMQRVEERVDAIHGVQAASFAAFVFNEGGWTDPISVPGRLKSDNDPDVDHRVVGAQYLNAMRIPVVLGRGLSPDDTAASRKVAVINETAARIYFPGGSPIGHTFGIRDDAGWQNIEDSRGRKGCEVLQVSMSGRCRGHLPVYAAHRIQRELCGALHRRSEIAYPGDSKSGERDRSKPSSG